MYEKLLDGIYESYSSGIFVDVGAGDGQTLLKVKNLGVHYVGFEPQISACSHVREIIAQNKINGRVYPVALSNKSGLSDLHVLGECPSTASIIKGFRPSEFYDRSEKVVTCTGDSLNLQNVGFIKIDVEGGELEVMEGFIETIKSQMPYITFEVLPNFLSWNNSPLSDNIIKYREERLAVLESIIRPTHTIHHITNDGIIEVFKIIPGVTSDLSNINYLAKPRKTFH